MRNSQSLCRILRTQIGQSFLENAEQLFGPSLLQQLQARIRHTKDLTQNQDK